MIKYKPYLLGKGIHNVSIDSIEVGNDNTIKIKVSNHKSKGYQNLDIPDNNNELITKLLNLSINIDELENNTNIYTKLKEAKFEGITTYVKLVCNEHGRIVIDDIIEEEVYKEEIKRSLKNCKRENEIPLPKEIDGGEMIGNSEEGKKQDECVSKKYQGNKDSNFRIEEKEFGDKFKVNEEGIFELQKSGDYVKISNYMILKSIYRNTDTGKYKAVIRYKAFGEVNEIEVDRDMYLNRSKQMELIKLGLDFRHDNGTKLVEFFRICEENIKKVINVHSKIGFSKNNGETCYKLYKCIGIDSKYVGNYEIKPKGIKEEYEKMLTEEIYGQKELEFIIISSLSAVIIGYIGEFLGLDTIIIHISGNSSSGKSTVLKLAISVFACPDTKKQGLFNTYNGTNNALLHMLGGIKGVPFALDELSMSNTNNFTKFIYAMANGADKQRLNKSSELKEKETWLTTILSNGEKSLVDNSNKNAGIHVRVIEATNFSWTKNAENSENINRTILKNYGHIGFEFAEYIMKLDRNDIVERFEKVKDEIYQKIDEKIKADSMTKRRCKNYAVLLITAYYYQEMMSVKLDIDGIIDMLIKIEKESISKRNFQQSVIDYIKQYIDKYKKKFETTDNTPTDKVGRLMPKKDYVEVEMNKISFEEMIKQGGYEDKNIVLKELKKKGYLNCESDRLTRSRKNSLGYVEDMYVIKLPKEKEVALEENFEEIVI